MSDPCCHCTSAFCGECSGGRVKDRYVDANSLADAKRIAEDGLSIEEPTAAILKVEDGNYTCIDEICL